MSGHMKVSPYVPHISSPKITLGGGGWVTFNVPCLLLSTLVFVTCIPHAGEFNAFKNSSVLAGEMSPRSTALHCSLSGITETCQCLSWTSELGGWKNGSSPELLRWSFLIVRCLNIFDKT